MSCLNATTEKQNSDNLSGDLSNWKREENKEIKLLILGTGSCGKSTFFKQMKIIHTNGFSETDKMGYKPVIHNNIKDIFTSTLLAAERFEIQISEKFKDIVDFMMKERLNSNPFSLDLELSEKLLDLWNEETFKKVLARRNEYDLLDSAEYYIAKIKTIAAQDYVPDVEDILNSRSKTVGIITQKMEVMNDNKKKQKFLFVDVGGQRNERKKWMHAFEGVTAIVFIVALSEYDQNLEEDRSQNRMVESLKLFKEVCDNKVFTTTAIIIFFNKEDIFKEKIKNSDPAKAHKDFEDYKGGCDYNKALTYFKERFKKLSTQKRPYFESVTTATNTKNIKTVFDSCKSIIIRELLKKSGF